MTITYLTKDGIEVAHHTMLEHYGGLLGVRSPDALASCAQQPQQQFAGQDLYPDLFSKAAAYAFFICQNHPFIDGNKRTAAFSMILFLELNGLECMAKNDDLEKMFLEIAKGKQHIESISEWIQANSRS